MLILRSTIQILYNRSSKCNPSTLLHFRNNPYNDNHLILTRRALSIKVAIVGSGPAGFYTAQKILKEPKVTIDLYEKLPVPFGLVRYGVAPDHQEVKNVINSFTSTANSERVNFYGNIGLGTDISLTDLIESYHAVILCYGSAQDKLLNIEGENLKNTISARNFVGWYNGVPEDKDLDIKLDCDTACIIGQGNVAIDCARILMRPSNLEKTDITRHAQSLLEKSRIRRVYIIGRRGPIQTSFTIKELRELVKMNISGTRLDPSTVFEDYKITSQELQSLSRQRRRLTELLMEVSANRHASKLKDGDQNFECIFKFFSKPIRINADFKTGRVCQLDLKRTGYTNPNNFIDQEAKPEDLEDYESIECGLIIRSIGYKAVMIDPSLPRDNTNGALLNTDGRVHGFNTLYCSGWLATGATGVIAGTLNSSHIAAKSLLEDIHSKRLVNATRIKPGSERVLQLLRIKKVQVVHFKDWLKIDEMERRMGAVVGKNREKIVNVNEMLNIASDHKLG